MENGEMDLIKTKLPLFRVREQCEAFANKRMRERQVGAPQPYFTFSESFDPDADLFLKSPRSERPSDERKVNKKPK